MLKTKTELKSSNEAEELENFKAVVRNLAVNAEKVVEEMDGLCIICGQTEEMAEKYHLLKHYLDYLRRLCNGEV